MPCRCDDFEEDPTVSKSTYDTMVKELDHVTQLLCYCCGTMLDLNCCPDVQFRGHSIPPELIGWFEKHHEADTKRVMKQMLSTLARVRLPLVTNSAETDLAGMFMDAAKKVHPVSKWHEQWFFRMAHQACEIHSRAKKQEKEGQSIVKRALAKLTPAERRALGIGSVEATAKGAR